MTKNGLLYLLVTIIPSVIISYYLTQQKITEIEDHYQDKAKWYANFHVQHVDNFIGETIARLDIMSKLIYPQLDDLNVVQNILKETHVEDKRFSGFYLANTSGDLLIGTNEMPNPINVMDRDYFQQAINFKKTTISEPHLGRVTGRFIITIATPISQDGQVKGVLLASIRLDEIKETMEKFLNEEIIEVYDDKGQKIIETDSISSNFEEYSINVKKVSWTLMAKIVPKEDTSFGYHFAQYLSILLVITHIFFILFHNYALKMRLRKQEQELKFQKLELIGDLAASTAHEIRNPLTGIKGLIQLLSEKYKENKDQLYFKVIQDEVDRINAIVSELLLIGKPTAYHYKTFDMNDVIKEIAPIIQSEANYANVNVKFHYSESALPVYFVKDHIKQVMINLSKNSIQSMSNGGQLEITLQKQEYFCMIQVKDNGIGIESGALKNVFDPFFTMKSDGTGLGLTVCKRIIDNCGGTISIKSKMNHGTEVKILIPLQR